MLYIHIPYCHRKCSYCGFYSVARATDFDAYVDALCRELRQRGALWHKPLETIYIGGGTPSLLSPGQLERIFATVEETFDTSLVEEVTIEANPENLSPEYLAGLAKMGRVNRLSIGIQSFSDEVLHMLNRVHTGRQALDAVGNAASAGFTNVSVDLIMGLPSRSVADFGLELDILATLLPTGVVRHLSCYELTVEPATILERQIQMKRLRLPDDDVVASQYDLLLEWCAGHGFHQYEVSNFALPGFHSRHNSRYWDRTPYIGVGPSAHSFDGSVRRWNTHDIKSYLAGAASGIIPCDEERLTPEDAFNEYVMTSLRTVKGIDKRYVEANFAQFVPHLSKAIAPFVGQGLSIVETADAYRPTPRGILWADYIAARLFLERSL